MPAAARAEPGASASGGPGAAGAAPAGAQPAAGTADRGGSCGAAAVVDVAVQVSDCSLIVPYPNPLPCIVGWKLRLWDTLHEAARCLASEGLHRPCVRRSVLQDLGSTCTSLCMR